MPKDTPEGTFADARAAMKEGDWDAFFDCLDRGSLAQIARNSLAILLGQEGDRAIPGGHEEEIRFEKTGDGWLIMLL